MDTPNYIAQCRIGDCATVRVLSITPNEEIICNRDCACLKESNNGSIQCSIHWIKNMVNFRTTALIIDYEIIMESDTDWDWPIIGDNFPIVNEDGIIYSGYFLCDDLISPNQIQGQADTVFPGTKGRCRFFYEGFPKEGKVVSILVNPPIGPQRRIDLLPNAFAQYIMSNESAPVPSIPQQDSNLQKRIELLESQMRRLRSDLEALQRIIASKGDLPNDTRAPMSDPGIGYHPLDNK